MAIEYGDPFSIRLRKDQEPKLDELAEMEIRPRVYFIREALDLYFNIKQNKNGVVVEEPA